MVPGRVPGLGTQELFIEGVIGKSHLRGKPWDVRVRSAPSDNPLESVFIHPS